MSIHFPCHLDESESQSAVPLLRNLLNLDESESDSVSVCSSSLDRNLLNLDESESESESGSKSESQSALLS
jgi:hypothetical protein